jgi:serine/threonine protein phosphatase PrpC
VRLENDFKIHKNIMSSKKSTLIRLTARTDKGEVRYHNEDNFLVGANLSTQDWAVRDEVFEAGETGSLLVIADGMGGANAGEVASQIAVEEIKKYFGQVLQSPLQGQEFFFGQLENALFQAHKAIIKHAFDNPECEGMGTTLLLVWVVKTRAYIGWSGDSRCYKYNPNTGLKLLIDDHSLVWDMVKKGELTEDEAAVHDERNIITQSLGADSYPPKPDFRSLELVEGDRLLLCSDGLNSMLLDSEITKILNQSDDITTNSRQLIEAANNAGGEDNITVVMYELVEVGEPEAIENSKKSRNTYTDQKPSKSWVWILLLLLVTAGLSYWWWSENQTQAPNTTPADTTNGRAAMADTGFMTNPSEVVVTDTQQFQNKPQVIDNEKNIPQLKQDKRNAEEQQRVNRTTYDKLITERDDIEIQMANEAVDKNVLASRKKILDEKISVQDFMIKVKQNEISRLNLLLKNNN